MMQLLFHSHNNYTDTTYIYAISIHITSHRNPNWKFENERKYRKYIFMDGYLTCLLHVMREKFPTEKQHESESEKK